MDITDEVKVLISQQFGIEKEKIDSNSHLQNDINADPLGISDLVVSIEEKFKIKIPQENIVKFNTVFDIVEFIEDQETERD